MTVSPRARPGQSATNGVLNASGACVSPPDGLPAFEYAPPAYASWAAGHAEMLRQAQVRKTLTFWKGPKNRIWANFSLF